MVSKNQQNKSNNNLKWFNRLTTVLVIVFFAYIIFKVIWSNYKISNYEVRYTVGEVYDFRKGAKVSPSFEFFFKLNDKKYYSSGFVPSEIRNKNLLNYKGKKYIVKYNVNDIDNNRIMYEYPVSDTVKLPLNGWGEIPEYIVRKEIDD